MNWRVKCRLKYAVIGRYFLPESAFIRAARRETLRLPVFLCMTPLETERMVSDSALRNAAAAAFASPAAIASSTVRHDERVRVRRALLTAVRRPMTRLAFFADLVFAMMFSEFQLIFRRRSGGV